MKRIVLLIIIVLTSTSLQAIDLHRVIGGRSIGMGRTGCCGTDIWSLQNNPSGIATLEGWHLGAFYENQWLLKETAFKNAAAVKKIRGVGTIGLLIGQFGGSQSNESLFGMAYARNFGPYLQLGLRVDYYLFHWGENYPNRGAFGFMLGLQSQLTEKMRVGVCLAHPLQHLKTIHEDRLPVVMRLGIAYRFTEDFTGQCEIERDNSREGIHLKTGLEYEIFKKFRIRIGAQHNPNLASFGVGYQLRCLEVDVAAEIHPLLGATIQVGMWWNVRG